MVSSNKGERKDIHSSFFQHVEGYLCFADHANPTKSVFSVPRGNVNRGLKTFLHQLSAWEFQFAP